MMIRVVDRYISVLEGEIQNLKIGPRLPLGKA